MASWITTKLLGLRKILSGGILLPERPAINFVSGATCVDNQAENRIDVIINNESLGSATFQAVPDTIVKRSSTASANFAGTCGFVNVAATGQISCDDDASVGGILTVGASSLGQSTATIATSALTTGTPNAITISGGGTGGGVASATWSSVRIEGGNNTSFSPVGGGGGTIQLQAGNATGGDGGQISLIAGNGLTNTFSSAGCILLKPGTGPGSCVVLGSTVPLSSSPGLNVVCIANATSLPVATPSGGGILFVDNGALKWKGSSGTVTTIAPA